MNLCYSSNLLDPSTTTGAIFCSIIATLIVSIIGIGVIMNIKIKKENIKKISKNRNVNNTTINNFFISLVLDKSGIINMESDQKDINQIRNINKALLMDSLQKTKKNQK